MKNIETKNRTCNSISVLNFVFLCFWFHADVVVYRNGNNGHHMHKSESLEDDLQRAISTAERRKVNIEVLKYFLQKSKYR